MSGFRTAAAFAGVLILAGILTKHEAPPESFWTRHETIACHDLEVYDRLGIVLEEAARESIAGATQVLRAEVMRGQCTLWPADVKLRRERSITGRGCYAQMTTSDDCYWTSSDQIHHIR